MCRMGVCVCVETRERKREKKKKRYEKEREREMAYERNGEMKRVISVCVEWVCVCV